MLNQTLVSIFTLSKNLLERLRMVICDEPSSENKIVIGVLHCMQCGDSHPKVTNNASSPKQVLIHAETCTIEHHGEIAQSTYNNNIYI